MRTKLTALLTSLLLLIIVLTWKGFINLKPSTVFRKGVTVGQTNLGGMTWAEGYNTLNGYLDNPIYINSNNKSRSVTPREMGMSIDRNIATKLTKSCRIGGLNLFCKNTSNERTDPNSILAINQDLLNKFVDDLEKDLQIYARNNIVIFQENKFRAVTSRATINVSRDIFADKKLLADMVTTKNYRLSLNTDPKDDPTIQATQNKILIKTVTNPLLIKYGRNAIYIPQIEVEKFVLEKKIGDYAYGIIDKKEIESYLKGISPIYGSEEIKIIERDSIGAIANALLFRAANYEINNAVILPLEGNPKTSGEVHEEYIELVKSQQRLYWFKDGKLYKSKIISTGLTWETPAGVYEVLNKVRMTISYYGDWYMPYYLPLGKVNGYYFGFHEIPYHIDAIGNIYSRDANTMGSPATGGCVQLTHDDAVDLFENVPVGTPVHIYE